MRLIRVYVRRKPWIKRVIGVIFFVIGILALITPLTPSVLFFVIGLELLGVKILSHDMRIAYKKRIKNAILRFLDRWA